MGEGWQGREARIQLDWRQTEGKINWKLYICTDDFRQNLKKMKRNNWKLHTWINCLEKLINCCYHLGLCLWVDFELAQGRRWHSIYQQPISTVTPERVAPEPVKEALTSGRNGNKKSGYPSSGVEMKALFSPLNNSSHWKPPITSKVVNRGRNLSSYHLMFLPSSVDHSCSDLAWLANPRTKYQ